MICQLFLLLSLLNYFFVFLNCSRLRIIDRNDSQKLIVRKKKVSELNENQNCKKYFYTSIRIDLRKYLFSYKNCSTVKNWKSVILKICAKNSHKKIVSSGAFFIYKLQFFDSIFILFYPFGISMA